jgi:hypothetical protein
MNENKKLGKTLVDREKEMMTMVMREMTTTTMMMIILLLLQIHQH